MDALQVHAAAAATAISSDFKDVVVGSSPPRGRCIRIYYGGERDPIFFGRRVLDAELIAQAVLVDAFWPAPETAAKRNRVAEGEMAAFAVDYRSRVDGDFTLGGHCKVLELAPARVERVVVSGAQFDRLQFEVGIDYVESSYAP